MDFDNNKNGKLFYHYFFELDNGSKEDVRIELDARTLNYIGPENPEPAAWTRLENHPCTNCPLVENSAETHCPIALSLEPIIPKFNNNVSYDPVTVRVETKERTYQSDCTMQRGLSSMLGILMVTNGCPTMEILKPMVRFHLPFASIDETVYRSASSYLLGQFFRQKAGLSTDLGMSGLMTAYEDIQLVNMGMGNRIRSISETDANTNAVVILDIFAKEMPMSILEGMRKLEHLYQYFIDSE